MLLFMGNEALTFISSSIVDNGLHFLRCFSIDGMDTVQPSKRLTQGVSEVTCKTCLEILFDMCCLLMCNSQPIRLAAAQKLVLCIINKTHAIKFTSDRVAECYGLFFLYLRRYRVDFINAKIQCKHFVTPDIMWLGHGFQVRILGHVTLVR